MKLKASIWWLCCVMLLLMMTIAEIKAQKCLDGEVLRFVQCPRTCKKSKYPCFIKSFQECTEEKTKKCICRGSFLRDEDSGKCVLPQNCPST